jgi:hypothetical protein
MLIPFFLQHFHFQHFYKMLDQTNKASSGRRGSLRAPAPAIWEGHDEPAVAHKADLGSPMPACRGGMGRISGRGGAGRVGATEVAWRSRVNTRVVVSG